MSDDYSDMGREADGSPADHIPKDLLSEPSEMEQTLTRMLDQRIKMRKNAFRLTIATLVSFVILEIYFLNCLIYAPEDGRGYQFILLAISPIVSTAMIVIAVLVGVFGGNREKDLPNTLSTVTKNSLKGLSSE